jgi:hypothetical protein
MEIQLGAGDDLVIRAPQASVIYTGGRPRRHPCYKNVGIADLSADDRITIGGVIEFHGGLRYKTSESPWATSYGGLFKSGINKVGELLVEIAGLGTVYILNWGASGGMSAPGRSAAGSHQRLRI